MNIKEFLNEIGQRIKYEPVKELIKSEIKQHIQDIKEEYIVEGIEEEDAEIKAVKQMGNPIEIGKSLNRIHRPKIDFKLLGLIILLIIYGFLNFSFKQIEQTDLRKALISVNCVIVLGIIVYFFDYKKLKKYSNIIYLIASAIAIFTNINGGEITKIFFGNINISFKAAIIVIPLFIISFVGFLTDCNGGNKNLICSITNKNNIIININF